MRLGNTPHKNWGIHIAAFLSRQPLVKGERLVRYEVNAVMVTSSTAIQADCTRNLSVVLPLEVWCRKKRNSVLVAQQHNFEKPAAP